jgi:hypothetical protein
MTSQNYLRCQLFVQLILENDLLLLTIEFTDVNFLLKLT